MVSFDNDWLFTRKETNLFIAAFWTEANGVVLFERLFIYSFINLFIYFSFFFFAIVSSSIRIAA